MKKKKIIVITAPSGAGKTFLTEIITREYVHDYEKVITSTTRAKRQTEKDGKDYYFLSEKNFLKKQEQGKLFEWELDVFPGTHYGGEKRELERIFSSGKTPIIVCEINGATKLIGKSVIHTIDREFLDGYHIESFFIYAPLEVLKQRILDDVKNGKRNDTELEIQQRFARLELELSFQDEFHHKIDNSEKPIEFVANELVNKMLYPEKVQ
jgi:guanylate kinase